MNISGISSAAYIPEIKGGYGRSRADQTEPEISAPERSKRDEYIPSYEELSAGIYKKSADENGQPKPEHGRPEKSDKTEQCTANTDKVDAEIRKLREKEEALSRELKNAEGEKKALLEKQLAQIQAELKNKDNDSYRRSHAVFS